MLAHSSNVMRFWSPLYDGIEEANGQNCMINILYLRSSCRSAGLSPDRIIIPTLKS